MKEGRRNFLKQSALSMGLISFLSLTSTKEELIIGAEKISKADQGGQSSEKLRAGAAALNVSPKVLPAAVDGYFAPRMYDKVLDPLTARVIMVEKGKEYFVFATIDAVAAPAAFYDEIKESVRQKIGLNPARICISATHTHFAPGLRSAYYTDINKIYIENLKAKMIEAIVQAHANLQPAEFGWTTAREPRHVFCRRFLMKPGAVGWEEPAAFTGIKKNIARMNPPRLSPDIVSPTGIPDQTIYILAFRTPQGKPIALLANYSTHYAGNPNGISADYFGVFAKKIKEKIQAPDNFVAMMTNGTSGDCNCINFREKQEKYDYKIVGEHVAEKTFDALKKIQYSANIPISCKQEFLTLGVRRPSPTEVQEAKAFLEENKNKNIRDSTRLYAERTILLEKEAPERKVPLQAIRLGDFGICSIPSEVYSFTGHDLRANTPFTTGMIISLANGSNGYLPTAEQFELGGYNTWRGSSQLEETAEPKIRAKLLSMLHEIEKLH